MIEQERNKYETIWDYPSYANFSPGEKYYELFKSISQYKAKESLIDIGCGSAKVDINFVNDKLNVELFDITDKGLQYSNVEDLRFTKGCIWRDLPFYKNKLWDYGYCCDIMEHIPIEYTMMTLNEIRLKCKNVFFSIASVPDNFGKIIGEPLHLTIMPYQWWLDKMKEIGLVVDARDLLDESIFYVRCYGN